MGLDSSSVFSLSPSLESECLSNSQREAFDNEWERVQEGVNKVMPAEYTNGRRRKRERGRKKEEGRKRKAKE